MIKLRTVNGLNAHRIIWNSVGIHLNLNFRLSPAIASHSVRWIDVAHHLVPLSSVLAYHFINPIHLN